MQSLIIFTLSRGRQYLLSIGTILVVALLCYAFVSVIAYKTVAFILLVTVSLLAIMLDIMPVLLAAAMSAAIWNFFFIPPRLTFHVATAEDTILLIMYFIIAMVNAVLTHKIREIDKFSRIREEKANSVKLYNTILNSLSHEIRTPLAAIVGASDNLLFNTELDEKNKKVLAGEISKAALRLNQQVENLLNISRLESGHIQPTSDWCDIEELIHGVVQRVEENSNRRVDISMKTLPICKIDKGLLDQVVYNLLNNAAIHTERHCKISIEACCHADVLEFIIRDNGAGFSDVNPKHIFDKFARSSAGESRVSGLGLSIVKGFTDALGGSVSATHVSGGGLKFELIFPVQTDAVIPLT